MFEVFVTRRVLQSPPKDGRFWCEDWSCPARAECEHHFGRSYDYAAMLDHDDPRRSKLPKYRPKRPPYGICQHFKRDVPREWLRGWCEPLSKHWCCTGCAAPECPRAPTNVVPFPQKGNA